MDFADVKAIMKNSGTAMLGVGASSSRNRAEEAAEQATLAPLIGSSIQSATHRLSQVWLIHPPTSYLVLLWMSVLMERSMSL